MRWMRLTLATVIGLSLVLIPSGSLGDTKRIKAMGSPGSFHWMPDARKIVKRDRIVWKNTTEYDHTVSAYRGKWSKNSPIGPGEKTAMRFKRAGTYKFRCLTGDGTSIAHSTLSSDGKTCSGMCGKVRVRRP